MTFIYRVGRPGLSMSNILFPQTWPMRGGKFPKDHPCYDDPNPTVSGAYRMKDKATGLWIDYPGEQPVSSTALGRFRSLGYWASCFPEGDGITFKPLRDKDTSTIQMDIAQCFGVSVTVER